MYRLLRDDEFIEAGLEAKNPRSKKLMDEYILHGSTPDIKSKYIACCKTLEGLKKFYLKISDKKKRIAEITIDETIPYFDLTDEATRGKYLSDGLAKDFAKKFDTVLLTGRIPRERMKYIENPWK